LSLKCLERAKDIQKQIMEGSIFVKGDVMEEKQGMEVGRGNKI
jgi:hypothetical protein